MAKAIRRKKARGMKKCLKPPSPPFGWKMLNLSSCPSNWRIRILKQHQLSQIGLVHFGKKKWCFLSRVDDSSYLVKGGDLQVLRPLCLDGIKSDSLSKLVGECRPRPQNEWGKGERFTSSNSSRKEIHDDYDHVLGVCFMVHFNDPAWGHRLGHHLDRVDLRRKSSVTLRKSSYEE